MFLHNVAVLKHISKKYSPRIFALIHMYVKHNVLPYAAIEKFIPKEGLILDAGCGYGYFSHYLLHKEPARSVLGIDTDCNRIQVAQASSSKDTHGPDFCVGDVQNFPMKEFNGIVMACILHHLPYDAWLPLFSNCYHALGKHGSLIIFEVDTLPRWKYMFSLASDYMFYPFQKKAYFMPSGKISALLREAGFHTDIVPMHSGSIFAGVLYRCHKP